MRAVLLLACVAAVLAAEGDEPFAAAWAAARAASTAAFVDRSGDLPPSVAGLGYDAYRGLRQEPQHRLWRDTGAWQLGWFHRGGLARDRVAIHLRAASGAAWREHAYDPGEWTIHPELAKELPRADLRSDLGFAGFKLWAPLNRADTYDEVISFIGASYFRFLGRGHIYGASCRGLAIGTGKPVGEEFPRFTAFWIDRPEADGRVRFAGLLDSPSVVGAFGFTLAPGLPSTLDVRVRLVARRAVDEVILAPVTSMFLWDGSSGPRLDVRPEVHDSDTLVIAGATAGWIVRPLRNDPGIPRSTWRLGVRGYGLLQRDRELRSYHDHEALYHRRPGKWVEPTTPWPAGSVWLIEYHSTAEGYDNITAGWRLDAPLAAGQVLDYGYRLAAVDDVAAPGLLRVADSEVVRAAGRVHVRVQFLGRTPPGGEVVPELATDAGPAVRPLLLTIPGGYEAHWNFDANVAATCWRVKLVQDAHPRSEQWQFPWRP